MIGITLQKIRDHSPCADGWRKVRATKEGLAYDVEFPLLDVLESNGMDDTLWCLRCLPEHSSLWRRYAVWCARQVEHLMTDPRSLAALDVAERHADGLATDAELRAAGAAARAASWAATGAAWSAGDAAAAAAREVAWDAALDAAWDALGAVRGAVAASLAAQEQKLREILTAGEWV